MENTAKTTTIKRTFLGEVMSKSGAKSAVVKVTFKKDHPKYGKPFLVSSRYHVHDEKNECKVGDNVKIEACRPLSATKHWRLVAVIK
ncbi:MAG: 30S ribosomal protein S17 [Candidatus Magasanikbacteria bacterium RIFOXYD2_FULL_41_14]|uniref:Small ribosomal subunit protein uS17 n=1 Tax=Candidatus Magasanikbacteria bacterium RIFOXYD2_FULL_41_14 TaxID=1798709 RepID=A0A1F6PC26_9BACT|nr:MAG: 30S ribosomal protein S17 [Candidatus Magasanikbacteria bacterium RIFOXYD2_FULL_41_14]